MSSQLKATKKMPVIIQGRFKVMENLVILPTRKQFKVLEESDKTRYKMLKEYNCGIANANSNEKKAFEYEFRLFESLKDSKAVLYTPEFFEAFIIGNPRTGNLSYIVIEYLKESLSDIIDNNYDRQFCSHNVFKIAIQLISGLKYLHLKNCFLNDFSDKTIFFTGCMEMNKCLKICGIENSKRGEDFVLEIPESEFVPVKFGSYAQNTGLGIQDIDNFESFFFIVLRMFDFFDLPDNDPDCWIDLKLQMWLDPEELIPFPFLLNLWYMIIDSDWTEAFKPSLLFWTLKGLEDVNYKEPLSGRVEGTTIILE